jgi:diaminopimelate decarboxylase
VSLRVNPDVDPRTHAYISTGLRGNKFGVPHDRARAAFRRAADLPGLRVVGIDCHIGSQITETAPFVDAADRVLDLVEAIEADGIPLHHLDLGGGLGIAYGDETPPRPQEMLAPVLARIDTRGHGHRRVLVEPGRSVVGRAGVLACTVIEVKDAPGKRFCIVDAGMNDLIRPALYDAWMPIVAAEPAAPGVEAAVCDVVGPVCESGDWLGRDRALAVRAGDVVAVLSAGAYAMSMASTYNSRPRPAEVLVAPDGAVHVVRERETLEDLRRGERLLP